MEIYRSAKQWNLMEVVTRELWRRHPDDPIHWNNLAWAVRPAVGINEAFEILSKAAEKSPEDAMTNSNIGYYNCQLGEITKAKERVGKAIKLDVKFKLLALDDVDLEPFWKEWEINLSP